MATSKISVGSVHSKLVPGSFLGGYSIEESERFMKIGEYPYTPARQYPANIHNTPAVHEHSRISIPPRVSKSKKSKGPVTPFVGTGVEVASMTSTSTGENRPRANNPEYRSKHNAWEHRFLGNFFGIMSMIASRAQRLWRAHILLISAYTTTLRVVIVSGF